ncbi:MAG: DUF2231 domain-containing protein [Bacteroidia bacterium]
MLPDFLKEFPNLHPLIVHFPVALLVIAVVGQIAALFFPKNIQLKWFTFLLLLGGCIGSLIAIYTAVHLSGDADENAFDLFETHRLFGILTFWVSLVATIFRFVTIKWFHKNWWEIILTALIISTGVLVTITGHHGAKMVYIYDVGPKGNGVLSK